MRSRAVRWESAIPGSSHGHSSRLSSRFGGAATLYVPASVARTGPRWEPEAKWTSEARYYVTPPKGYVTKRETAIAIGRAAILDRYDAELLEQLEPLDAKRFGDTWVVYSYFPKAKSRQFKDMVMGGATTVEISASTGTIQNLLRAQ